MKYTIQKITIDKESAEILVAKMVKWVELQDASELDKRAKETDFQSDDGKIDIYLRISFNSEYHRGDGGVYCINRGVVASVTMCLAETGSEIEYVCPVALEEEIEKYFWI